jgi:hypothetical protein
MMATGGEVGSCFGVGLENQEGVRVTPQHKNGDAKMPVT